ncbi:MAG: IPT/TIG domain-containing protein [bacterium]
MKVTSFSPQSGSIYGGTILTITGINFSPKANEN